MAVVQGGPLVFLSDIAAELPRHSDCRGTAAIVRAWKVTRTLDWTSDVSGPFVVFLVDKRRGLVEVVTDMMGLLPVYYAGLASPDKGVVVGTHLDLVAAVAGRSAQFDCASVAEFVERGEVTYPYTLFKSVRQLPPAACISIEPDLGTIRDNPYWVPSEDDRPASIHQAARELREHLGNYIENASKGAQRVAVFLSGGEDARAVLSMIPSAVERTCFTLVDQYNLEAQIAERAARMCGARWQLYERSAEYYCEQFEDGCRLVGSQHTPSEMHALGLSQREDLAVFDAVFTGDWADTLLKGYFISTNSLCVGGLPVWRSSLAKGGLSETISGVVESAVRDEILQRRADHLSRLKSVRPLSAAEWYRFWPLSCFSATAFYQANRRLCRVHEPFADAGVVKLAARIPQEWKIDRNVYRLAVGPAMGRVGLLPQVAGWVPRFPWWLNVPAGLMVKCHRRGKRMLGLVPNINHAAWPEWHKVVQTEAFHRLRRQYAHAFEALQPIFTRDCEGMFGTDRLALKQFWLLQVLRKVSETL